jgi:Fe-S-cluster containining protein
MERDDDISRRLCELGPDYFLKQPPALIEYDPDKLSRRLKNERVFARLEKLYSPIPEATCGDCGDVCCRATPDFYLVEYLNAWRHVRHELADPALEAEITARAFRWAFLSLVQRDVYCPFLFDGRCVAYSVRPFNCRVWGLEDDAWYERRAARARESLEKQRAYFAAHGVKMAALPAELVLPKCKHITLPPGSRPVTEPLVNSIETEIAMMHRAFIKPEEFRSLNFHLHFPGHVALKKVAPGKYDETRVAVALEFQMTGSSPLLDRLIESCGGRLP